MAEIITAIIVAAFASSGFWAVIQTKLNRKYKKEDDSDATKKEREEIKATLGELCEAMKKMEEKESVRDDALMAILHDKIYKQCIQVLEDGGATAEELNNLEHLYKPYRQLGGNGTCEKLYNEVQELPTLFN